MYQSYPISPGNGLKTTLVWIVTLLLTSGCGIARRNPPIIDKVEVVYRDSTIVHVDTIKVPVPVEKIVEVVPKLDTLYLETSIAKSTAYLDTTIGMLRGSIENKPQTLSAEVCWKERLVYRDSLVVKEIPVEVLKTETRFPKTYWYLLYYFIGSIALGAVFVYFKLK